MSDQATPTGGQEREQRKAKLAKLREMGRVARRR